MIDAILKVLRILDFLKKRNLKINDKNNLMSHNCSCKEEIQQFTLLLNYEMFVTEECTFNSFL